MDCGETNTTVHEFCPSLSGGGSISHLKIGGMTVTDCILELLLKHCTLQTQYEREFARIIKEKCCFVAQDIDAETHVEPRTYALPDG